MLRSGISVYSAGTGLGIRLCETPDAFEVELGLQDFKQFATQATGEQQQRAGGGLRLVGHASSIWPRRAI